MKTISYFLIGAIALAAPITALACSTCGCTLNGDWDSQGLSAQPGLRIELRHDFLNQSQLRSGSSTVNRGAIVLPAEREIEQQTINRYTTLGIDYSPTADWGINLQLPYINRTHSTIAAGDTAISGSQSHGIGDARLIVRYQGLTPERNIGLQFGLKLPSGDDKNNFNAGPQQGQPLDRGLQPGSGTTDLLLGAFYTGNASDDIDYFVQGLVQAPLNARDGFRPGASLTMNLGFRYVASEKVTPELQFNARTVRRDSGVNSDRDNSGGSLLYLTPGATIALAPKLKVFGFVQVPLFQHVNGYQLAPRYTASIGVRYEL